MRFQLGIVLACVFPLAVTADIYRSVDEDGNVVFSDTPTEGAEKVDVQKTQTFEPPAGTRTFQYDRPESEPAPRYRRVAIESPGNDESIRQNNGNITIRISLEPGLRPGDRVQLFMDGQQVASGRSLSVGLNNVDRGSHTLVAKVVSSGGQVLKESDSVTFHLQRHSILNNPPPAGPLNPPGGAN